MEAEIDRFGLQDRFCLTGWITPEEVLDWFRQSDVLFMPSLSEGLPVTGVQGMAMGLALVMSDAGGNAELVFAGENGFLVEQTDQAGYERALRALLGDPERLLSARLASRRLAKKFDLEKILNDYNHLFLELLSRK